MVKVMFVCLGNIIRSPMAEAIFQSLVDKDSSREYYFISSSGVKEWHIGERPHPKAQQILSSHGYKVSDDKTAKLFSSKDLVEFDFVIVMDRKTFSYIGPSNKVRYLTEFLLETGPDPDILDPYVTGDFESAYHTIEMGCIGLLAYIKKINQDSSA